jgi:cytochrome c550
VRLLVVPAVLFAIVSGAVFAFAQWHPAKRDTQVKSETIARGDAARGETLFAQNCQTCHGEGGEGGGIGPTLVGSETTIGQARATIENGSGVMPGGLVTGEDLDDVLAYLQLVFAR